uniref:Uncharacterized protein n=1 Tax=Anopheles coluzzii TaxID=1518534 RepID=A0A8W7PXQ9_ANOCL
MGPAIGEHPPSSGIYKTSVHRPSAHFVRHDLGVCVRVLLVRVGPIERSGGNGGHEQGSSEHEAEHGWAFGRLAQLIDPKPQSVRHGPLGSLLESSPMRSTTVRTAARMLGLVTHSKQDTMLNRAVTLVHGTGPHRYQAGPA